MRNRLLSYLIFISLCSILWASYSFFLDVPYNAKRLAEGVILVLGATLIITSPTLQGQWVKLVRRITVNRWMFSAVSLLGILGVLSSSFADYPVWSFMQLSHYFLLLNIVLLIALTYRSASKYFEYIFLGVVACMAGLYIINVGISYLYTFFILDFPLWPDTKFMRIWIEGSGFKYPKPFSNFVNIRYFNHIQTWTLPLITLLVLRIPKRYWAFSKITFIVACGWWMLAFASEARGTLLASLLALVFVGIMYRHKAKQWLRAHSLSAVIGLALYGLFFKVAFWSSGSSGGTEGGLIKQAIDDNGRFTAWEKILDVVVENPLFGIGPMHFPPLESTVLATPHNVFLQFAVEWGIPAALIFTGVVITGFYYWIRNTNKAFGTLDLNSSSVNVRVAITASLLAGLIHSGYSNIFNSPLSQILMVLVVGWAVGIYFNDTKKEPDEPGATYLWQRLGLVLVSLFAAGFLTWSYVSHVPELDKNRFKYLQTTQSKKLVPRYWDQGVLGVTEKGIDN